MDTIISDSKNAKGKAQKSSVLKIGKNSPIFFYTMTDENGNPPKLEFKEVQSVQDLGVKIDSKQTFSEHVDSIESAPSNWLD